MVLTTHPRRTSSLLVQLTQYTVLSKLLAELGHQDKIWIVPPSTFFIQIPMYGIIPSRLMTMYQEQSEQAFLEMNHHEMRLRSITIASLLLLVTRNGWSSSLVYGKSFSCFFTSNLMHVVIVQIARRIILSQSVQTQPKKASIMKKAILLLSLRHSK